MRFEKTIAIRRRKCKRRVWAKLRGTAQRPRLSVFRSNRHIHVQLIDDAAGRTIIAANTRQSALAKTLPQGRGANKAAARIIGKALAQQALAKGITKICNIAKSIL